MKIETLEELKEAVAESQDGILECYIALNGGLRSSKRIQHWEDGMEFDDQDADNIEEGETMEAVWCVDHEIDDTCEAFESDEEMLSETHVGEAIEKGALFAY